MMMVRPKTNVGQASTGGRAANTGRRLPAVNGSRGDIRIVSEREEDRGGVRQRGGKNRRRHGWLVRRLRHDRIHATLEDARAVLANRLAGETLIRRRAAGMGADAWDCAGLRLRCFERAAGAGDENPPRAGVDTTCDVS